MYLKKMTGTRLEGGLRLSRLMVLARVAVRLGPNPASACPAESRFGGCGISTQRISIWSTIGLGSKKKKSMLKKGLHEIMYVTLLKKLNPTVRFKHAFMPKKILLRKKPNKQLENSILNLKKTSKREITGAREKSFVC